jgi:hypothetical protein
MVTFKTLDSKNSAFNPSLLQRLCVLYKGGYDVWNNADLFLHQLASETPASFEDRKQCAAYLPLMSDTIDYYAAMLFSGEMSVTEAADADDEGTLGDEADDESVYKLFLARANLRGNSLEEVMRHTTTDALTYGYAFVGVDFPRSDEVPTNLLEEEVLQAARPYLCDIDPDCVINWSCNESDKFNWVVIKSDNVVQPDPLQPPMHQIEFKIWKMENGTAKWQLYQTELLKMGKMPAPNDDVSLVEEGITSFKEIPVLKLCLPTGLSLGPKIAPMCENIFQRTSILFNGENKSLNAMRVVFLGDESNKPGGATPAMVQENPFRHLTLQTDWESKGFGVLGANDKMDIIESQGHAFKIVDEQIDRQIEKVKETVHQMSNTAAASKGGKSQGRSAAAQQESRHATEILLTAYGNIVRDFIKSIMNCISTARNESIVWTVDGFENFTIMDRSQLTEEAKNFPQVIQDSKSQTFSRLYTEKFYLGMLDGASHEEAKQIRREILDAIDKMPTAQPMQNAPALPAASSAAPTNPPESDDSMALGPSGQPLLPEGAHLQTGEHIDPQQVFDHLADDYNEKDIEWVLHIAWIGPVEVPLSSIDFSNMDNWQATQEPDHVEMFADKMANDNMTKPIVLVNAPAHDGKMMIVDGHHRALAALQNGQPVPAYVGQVGRLQGPWSKLHSKQVGKKVGSGLLVSSQQANQTSLQKDISTQVSQSEKAKGGKTK